MKIFSACLWIAILTTTALGANRHPVMNLKPGHWLEVPDSQMEKVGYKFKPGVYFTKNGIGLKAIMKCWSGGAYDAKHDRLLIWGGGHSAYGGNEIYGFDVKTLKWQRLSEPSLKVCQGYPNGPEKYSDGTPRACHTYDYIQYAPQIDSLCSFGTAANFPDSKGGKTTWAYSFEKKKWQDKGPATAYGIGAYSAVDPVTGFIYVRGNSRGGCLARWEPLTAKWTNLTGGVNHKTDYYQTAAIDPIGRRFVGVGGKRGGKMYMFGGTDKVKQEEVKTTGLDMKILTGNPGFQYDPVLDKFVAWRSGANFYLLDPVTWKWETRTPASGNKVVPGKADKTGTYGRFRYIPSLNAYIVVNSTRKNVFIGRLSDRTQQPIPQRFISELKGKDTALLKWVAVQVAKWPRTKAQSVLKTALQHQKTTGAADIIKILETALEIINFSK
jgi:hypothetical protein